MGAIFECIEKEYSCSYSSWNAIRIEMACATMRYLENKVDMTNTEEMRQTQIICEILAKKTELTTGVDEFLAVMADYPKFINYFIALDIYGLYVLLNKSDESGRYSPGNAKDILILFKRVKSFILNNNVKRRIPYILKIFRESVNTNHYVTIM
jgi:hypothetical protein